MNFLNAPKDVAIMVFLRIAFGILAIAEMLGQIIYKRWYKGYYSPDSFGFEYIGFSWVQAFPEPLMSLFMILVLAAAVGIMLGYRYKWSAWVFFLGYTYIYLMEKGLYLNHGYLFCWLSAVMIFLPAHRGWSIDLRHGRLADRSTVPLWTIALPALFMAIVYFFGGLAKINEDWLAGIPLIKWVGYRKDMWLFGPLWENPMVGFVMAWSGMLLDCTAPFMLLWKRTRLFALGLLIIFHLTNALIFAIGIFPWMSLVLSSLFFPADWPRKLWNWFAKRWPQAGQYITKIGRPEITQQVHEESFALNGFRASILGLIILIHLFLPLRNRFFPGDVAWTEQGHRYAWRMMLRHKSGKGTFTVKGKNDKVETVRPSTKMNSKFVNKMYTHPDMIWQFAQFLKQEYEEKGWEDVEVYARIRVRLNYRKYHPYIDPTVDLAKVKWNFFEHKEWVLPEVREAKSE